MHGALYIAKAPEPALFKLGQTTKGVVDRVRQLSGQGRNKYQLLKSFPTDHPVQAEKLAFAWLQNQGVFRVGGPKDEHFATSVGVLEQACLVGIRGAVALSGGAHRPQGLSSQPQTPEWRFPSGKVWEGVQQFPLQHRGIASSLGELLRVAPTCTQALARVRKLGFELVAYSPVEAQFLVEWGVSPKLHDWLLSLGARHPGPGPTYLILKKKRQSAHPQCP